MILPAMVLAVITYYYASTIFPAMALAAAVLGEAKKISTFEVPILPKKFRLLVATTLSPSVRIPQARPQQSPQPGWVTMAPASTKSVMYPAFTASK